MARLRTALAPLLDVDEITVDAEGDRATVTASAGALLTFFVIARVLAMHAGGIVRS